MNLDGKWIRPAMDIGNAAAEFEKTFVMKGSVRKAELMLTAVGVYEARLNGCRIGTFILAPGCTAYDRRLQVQRYDITSLLRENNTLTVQVGKGWQRSRISEKRPEIHNRPCAIIGSIHAVMENGEERCWNTDETWRCGLSRTIFNDFWDGETYDASMELPQKQAAVPADLPKDILTPQEGPEVRKQETISVCRFFVTPRGEQVLDFGQEIAGYVAFSLEARKGQRVVLTCGEMLDREGNFYRENYRSAEAKITYICRDGQQEYKPSFTFYGFRYIRLDEFPGEVNPDCFHAVALYSDLKRTGWIRTSHNKLNRLFLNALWSQRSNFVDIPTDCPQRDERFGWTGDAQVFARTASYNYMTLPFFRKWLRDIRSEQRRDGSIPNIVPNFLGLRRTSAAWGDVMTILPWQLYLMYGDREILRENFEAMRRWIDYISGDTMDEGLWTAEETSDESRQKHYGDWLALDAEAGCRSGRSSHNFIASAFYAHSTDLLVRTGHVLEKDVSDYEALLGRIRSAFQQRFSVCSTQTEHVLALAFHLSENEAETAAGLANLLEQNGSRMTTGFVGTPYLLHVLSDNGYADLAYNLLLQETCPSWLYEVNHGATTIWEHWDSRKEDGSFWSTEMNSFNHYAYGSVMDWLYSVAGGIRPDEHAPGFERAIIAPVPSRRIESMQVCYESVRGRITSGWVREAERFSYTITTPVPSQVRIRDKTYEIQPGSYMFYSD